MVQFVLSFIQPIGLLGGILFHIMGMHYCAHDEENAISREYTALYNIPAPKLFLPSGIKKGWHIRGLRYHIIGGILFSIGGLASLRYWLF